jgi:hypothetical protein
LAIFSEDILAYFVLNCVWKMRIYFLSLFLLFPDTSHNNVESSKDKFCPRADFSFTRINVFVGKPFHYMSVSSAL